MAGATRQSSPRSRQSSRHAGRIALAAAAEMEIVADHHAGELQIMRQQVHEAGSRQRGEAAVEAALENARKPKPREDRELDGLRREAEQRPVGLEEGARMRLEGDDGGRAARVQRHARGDAGARDARRRNCRWPPRAPSRLSGTGSPSRQIANGGCIVGETSGLICADSGAGATLSKSDPWVKGGGVSDRPISFSADDDSCHEGQPCAGHRLKASRLSIGITGTRPGMTRGGPATPYQDSTSVKAVGRTG